MSSDLRLKAAKSLKHANELATAGGTASPAVNDEIKLAHQFLEKAEEKQSKAREHYEIAQGLNEQVPIYAREQGEAKWHEEYMWNPLAPLPRPPLV